MSDLDDTLTLIQIRASLAQRKYGDLASLHEAYGVLAEEVDEFFRAVQKRPDDPSRQLDAEQEALDIAAVALRIAMQARKLVR